MKNLHWSTITPDMREVMNGFGKSGDDDGYFTMRYSMDKIGGTWYITEKRVIERQ